MRFITFLFVFIVLSTISCHSSNKRKEREKEADNNIIYTEEGFVIITGRVRTGGSYQNGTWLAIEEEGEIQYSVYPPEKEDELRNFIGYLFEFTAVILDEPQGFGGTVTGRTLTPINWKVILEPWSTPTGPLFRPPDWQPENQRELDVRRRDEPIIIIERADD